MGRAASDRSVDFPYAVEHATFPILITKPRARDNLIVYANRAFEQLSGYDRAEVLGRDCRFLQGPDTDRSVVAELRQAIDAGVPIRRELLNYRKNGEPFWNELSMRPQRNRAGKLVGFMGIQIDVSAKRQTEHALREAEARLNSVIENTPGYIYRRVLKPDGRIEYPYLSQSLARLLRLTEKASATIGLAEMCRYMDPADFAQWQAAIARSAAGMSPLNYEFRIITPDGEERWIRSHSNPRRCGENVVWDSISIDVTREKAIEAQLAFLACNDQLTGLPNRSLFDLSLQKAIATARPNDLLTLFHIDLCGLREINDSLGRAAGDSVLRSVADRFGAVAEAQAGTMLARTGGDEFSVKSVVNAETEAADLANRLIRSLAAPIATDTKEISIKASIGYATLSGESCIGLSPQDQAAELMRQADVALLSAKRTGPGLCSRYQRDDDDRVRHRVMLKQSMQRALLEQQFELHYQPLFDLASGGIVGVEALIRWPHPQLGMQPPDMFIPLAEEMGLIVPLGEWIAREAVRQAQWRALAGLRQIPVSINISAKQLLDWSLPDMLERVLTDYGAPADRFELELTEGVLIDSSPETVAVLKRLKGMGFTLTVDDFGSGYSSLRYLQNFPVDKLKIDQTFIRRMVVGSSDASIVRAVIAMAKSLGLGVVAEGIETATQRDFLRKEGCPTGQGYLFSKPLPHQEFAQLLERQVAPAAPFAPASLVRDAAAEAALPA